VKPLLLLASACAACGETQVAPNESSALSANAAETIGSADIAEADEGCGGDAEGPIGAFIPPDPLTGNWRFDGRGYDDFFFTKMTIDNRNRPQRLWILMQNSDGRSLDLIVRPSPPGPDFDQTFHGSAWEVASTAERAALVKAEILRLARISAQLCGTRLEGLEEDLASFDRAFARA
jgi:hypothetical protein